MPPLCISLSTCVAGCEICCEATNMFDPTIKIRPTISRLLHVVQRFLPGSPAATFGSIFLAICAMSIAVTSVNAQSSFGSIRGIATDASGATISGAAVALHSVEENTDRATTTDGDGAYLFNNVKPGQYVVTVARTGFSTTNIDGIALNARQDLRVNATLADAAAITVDVNA